ncbi:hypothetical protein ACWF99_14200 [Nocardia sp. NPDC055002]
MTPRSIALIGGVTASAAALSVAVVLSVDWSEVALYDPARILLLGPREAFSAAQHSPKFGQVELVLFLLTGASFVASGLFTWTKRPHELAGPLFVVAGLVWLACGVRRSSDPVLFTAGAVLTNIYLPVMIPVLLGFPSGRLRQSWERRYVRLCWALAVFGVSAEWMFFDPREVPAPHRSTSVNLLLIRHDPVLADRIQLIVGAFAFLIAVTAIVVVIKRWRSGTAAYRSGFAPIMVLATVAGVSVLWVMLTAIRFPGSLHGWTLNLRYIPMVLLPMAIAFGQVRYRMARTAVGDAMVEIGATPISSGFVEALRRALHDPTLALWNFDAERRGYVDDRASPGYCRAAQVTGWRRSSSGTAPRLPPLSMTSIYRPNPNCWPLYAARPNSPSITNGCATICRPSSPRYVARASASWQPATPSDAESNAICTTVRNNVWSPRPSCCVGLSAQRTPKHGVIW